MPPQPGSWVCDSEPRVAHGARPACVVAHDLPPRARTPVASIVREQKRDHRREPPSAWLHLRGSGSARTPSETSGRARFASEPASIEARLATGATGRRPRGRDVQSSCRGAFRSDDAWLHVSDTGSATVGGMAAALMLAISRLLASTGRLDGPRVRPWSARWRRTRLSRKAGKSMPPVDARD